MGWALQQWFTSDAVRDTVTATEVRGVKPDDQEQGGRQ